MNLTQILDASALAVLVSQAGWIGLLYRRMGRLRSALDGAGEVVGQLDAASRRLDDSAGGIVQKVRDGIAEVDSKIGACRRLSQELTTASRHAEEVATRLDQALRLNRRLHSARAAAPPRELVEPLGLAERLAGRPAASAPSLAAPSVPDGRPAIDLPVVDLLPLDLPRLDHPAEPGDIHAGQEDAAPQLPPLLSLALEQPVSGLPIAPPLGSMLAAELLFAERPAPEQPASPLPGGGPRTFRVKLD